jgi:hypothetical protein
MTLCAGAGVYVVASLAAHPTPFLLSLGCALGAWTLGWLIDVARR